MDEIRDKGAEKAIEEIERVVKKTWQKAKLGDEYEEQEDVENGSGM